MGSNFTKVCGSKDDNHVSSPKNTAPPDEKAGDIDDGGMVQNNRDCYFSQKDFIEIIRKFPEYQEWMYRSQQSQLAASSKSRLKQKRIKWKEGEVIGHGSYGRVIMGLNNQTGSIMAVKQVHINGSNSIAQQDRIRALEIEIELLRQLDHKNIVRYYGSDRNKTTFNIFLEFISGGTIASLVEKYGPLNENLARVYTKQILEGLEYLHVRNTIHRDIKGANVLVDNRGICKLADFGTAKKVMAVADEKYLPSIRGTVNWMAPEVIKQTCLGRSSDIWSVGCTVLEMMTGKAPWSHLMKPGSNQVSALYTIATAKTHPPLPEGLSAIATDFLKQCFRIDPKERPNVIKLLKHKFITGYETIEKPLPVYENLMLPVVKKKANLSSLKAIQEQGDKLEFLSHQERPRGKSKSTFWKLHEPEADTKETIDKEASRKPSYKETAKTPSKEKLKTPGKEIMKSPGKDSSLRSPGKDSSRHLIMKSPGETPKKPQYIIRPPILKHFNFEMEQIEEKEINEVKEAIKEMQEVKEIKTQTSSRKEIEIEENSKEENRQTDKLKSPRKDVTASEIIQCEPSEADTATKDTLEIRGKMSPTTVTKKVRQRPLGRNDVAVVCTPGVKQGVSLEDEDFSSVNVSIRDDLSFREKMKPEDVKMYNSKIKTFLSGKEVIAEVTEAFEIIDSEYKDIGFGGGDDMMEEPAAMAESEVEMGEMKQMMKKEKQVGKGYHTPRGRESMPENCIKFRKRSYSRDSDIELSMNPYHDKPSNDVSVRTMYLPEGFHGGESSIFMKRLPHFHGVESTIQKKGTGFQGGDSSIFKKENAENFQGLESGLYKKKISIKLSPVRSVNNAIQEEQADDENLVKKEENNKDAGRKEIPFSGIEFVESLVVPKKNSPIPMNESQKGGKMEQAYIKKRENPQEIANKKIDGGLKSETKPQVDFVGSYEKTESVFVVMKKSQNIESVMLVKSVNPKSWESKGEDDSHQKMRHLKNNLIYSFTNMNEEGISGEQLHVSCLNQEEVK